MSEIEISTKGAYLGGNTSHICHLSDGLFIAVYGSSTTVSSYILVSKCNDMRSPAAAFDVLANRKYRDGTPVASRIWKLSSTAALMHDNGEYYVILFRDGVLEVQPPVKLSPSTTGGLWGTGHSTAPWNATTVDKTWGTGSILTGMNVGENRVCVMASEIRGTRTLYLLEYDDSTGILTSTMKQAHGPASYLGITRSKLTKVPDSDKFLLVICSGGTANYLFPTYIALLNNDLELVRTFPLPTTASTRIVAPLTENKLISFVNAMDFYLFDNESWGKATKFATTFYGGTGYFSMVAQCDPVSSNSFILSSTVWNDNLWYGSIAIRPGLVASDGGGFSSGSQSGNGTSVVIAGLYFDQEVIQRIDENLFFAAGRSGDSSFQVTFIYA